MSQLTFAAIDVGSNEISMKIYEISKKNGVCELDHIRHTIELGADTYKMGKICHAFVDEVCNVLIGFTLKMKEYNVTDYVAYSTSAIREAQNNLFILDQIKLTSGIKLKILSNSQQRFLYYKAVAFKEKNFNQMIQKGTYIIDVGAGSIQISIYNHESLISSQNIKLGSLRIRELLYNLEHQTNDYQRLISEYIDNDLQTFQGIYGKDIHIKHIIGVGESLVEYIKMSYLQFISNQDHIQEASDKTTIFCEKIKRDSFLRYYETLSQTSVEKLSHQLGIPKEQAALILPSAMIFYKMFQLTTAEYIWLPDITICDGIMAEFTERKDKISPIHPFHNDILSAVRNIAVRYHCNQAHNQQVETFALEIFEQTKKIHGLGKQEKLLLQIAAILHNCGEYINMESVPINSYHIIMQTEIIGLSYMEREIIANIALNDSEHFPEPKECTLSNPSIYITLCKLCGIFRIANALDRCNRQKFHSIKVVIKNSQLIITAETMNDITLEQYLVEQKADFFKEVFGIRPILKQKRSI